MGSRLGILDIISLHASSREARLDHAHTLDRLAVPPGNSLSLWSAISAALPSRPTRYAWAARRGGRLAAVASIRPRSSHRSWEVDHLTVAPGSEDELGPLLDAMPTAMANHGGERIFLRLEADDPLADVAKTAGFFPCINETLYVARDLVTRDGTPPTDNVRFRQDDDDHGLFRLHSAAIPSEVRCITGMTLEQWKSSRERPGGPVHEYVVEDAGAPVAWLARTERPDSAVIQAEAHPEHEDYLPPLVDMALWAIARSKAVYCLVASYQPGLGGVLSQRGFEPLADYVTVVKSTTLSARDTVRGAVEAAST